jgi:hypothetical protein
MSSRGGYPTHNDTPAHAVPADLEYRSGHGSWTLAVSAKAIDISQAR